VCALLLAGLVLLKRSINPGDVEDGFRQPLRMAGMRC